MMEPDVCTHNFSPSSTEALDPEETFLAVDRLTQAFLSIDGETSRTLIPTTPSVSPGCGPSTTT